MQILSYGHSADSVIVTKTFALKKLGIPLDIGPLFSLCQYIEENKKKWANQLYKGPLRIKKIISQFPCTIQYHSSRTIYIKLSSKNPDVLIEQGAFKRVSKVWDYTHLKIRAYARTIISTTKKNKMCAKEIKWLKIFRSSNKIAKLIDNYEYRNENYFKIHVMIFRYYNRGDLLKFIEKEQGHIKLNNRIALALDCLEAVVLLHQEGLNHGDIKPENFLLDEKLKSYLTDFGVAGKKTNKTSSGGTLFYQDPCALECILDRGLIDKINWKANDIFALGCTLYILFHEKYPPWFEYLTNERMEIEPALGIIKNFNQRYKAQYPPCNLIRLMLDPLPQNRPTASELLEKFKTIKKNLPKNYSNFQKPLPEKIVTENII